MGKRITASCAVAVAVALAAFIVFRGRVPSSDTPVISASEAAAGSAEAVRIAAPSARDVGAATTARQLAGAPVPRKFQRRFMFDCGDVRIFVRIGEGEAALLPESSLTGHWIPLTSAGSAWRGRYANEDLAFRPDGDHATFVLGDDTLENCVATRDRGALAEVNGGVYFQAFGTNPGWTFEIAEYALMLTTDGARRVEIPLRAPTDNGARMTFRSVVGTQEMIATLDRIPCYDAASGETFELTVAVTFDREWYYGCGRRISYR
jgi:uncharacterized membrane protein